MRLSGDDVRRFCNGMFTNNVRDLPLGSGQRSAMCDAKGKLHGLMDLYLPSEDAAIVALEGVSAASFLERYSKYILFDDVEAGALDRAVLTLQGDGAEGALASAGLPIPETRSPYGWTERDSVAVAFRPRGLSGGFDLFVPPDRRDGIRALLVAGGAREVSSDDLDALRVEAGRVRWPVDMPARFLPHELGLRDEALSFEKGCYLGQEIVHRVEVQGQIRRHLAGVRLPEGFIGSSSVELRDGDEVVGSVTSPVLSARLGSIGLAVIRAPRHLPGTRLRTDAGEAVVSALPFA